MGPPEIGLGVKGNHVILYDLLFITRTSFIIVLSGLI